MDRGYAGSRRPPRPLFEVVICNRKAKRSLQSGIQSERKRPQGITAFDIQRLTATNERLRPRNAAMSTTMFKATRG